jgi:hypothetical protein
MKNKKIKWFWIASTIVVIILIGFIWNSQIYPETKKVTITTDKEKYVTNSVVSEGIKVNVVNNLNYNIFFFSGCADTELDIYKFENGEWSIQFKDGSVCAAMPNINELKPRQNITLGLVLNEKGKYKVSFSYSLEKKDRWQLGDQNEVFSNSFEIELVEPTLENSLELCKDRGDFTAIGGFHYSYSYCKQQVAIWVADKNPDKAIEICDEIQINQCYEVIAKRMVNTSLDKALYACTKEKNYKPNGWNFRDICYMELVGSMTDGEEGFKICENIVDIWYKGVCQRLSAEKIVNVDKNKAKEICNNIQESYQKDLCLKNIE